MKQLRGRVNWNWRCRLFLLALMGLLVFPTFGQAPANGTAPQQAPCDLSGKDEIKIACDYAALPGRTSDGPRIVLKRAMISFETDEENYMRIELTFANAGQAALAEPHSVYLAIDDDAGNNYFRRRLPEVDLLKLSPGKQITFSQQVLVGVLQPRRYQVHLWIPSSDPALAASPAHNLQLSNIVLSDAKAGLHRLATFEVVR